MSRSKHIRDAIMETTGHRAIGDESPLPTQLDLYRQAIRDEYYTDVCATLESLELQAGQLSSDAKLLLAWVRSDLAQLDA